jgi:hypothetical protein
MELDLVPLAVMVHLLQVSVPREPNLAAVATVHSSQMPAPTEPDPVPATPVV